MLSSSSIILGMQLSSDQVKKVAKLANLNLTPQEEEKFSEQLSKILDYVDELNSVDTSAVEPTFNVSGRENILREDIAQTGLTQEEAVSNASVKRDGFFVSRGVFNNE